MERHYCLGGDSNVIWDMSEAQVGSCKWNVGSLYFGDSISQLSVVDLRTIDSNLTWWNSCPEDSVFRKRGGVIVDAKWLQHSLLVMPNFMPRSLSEVRTLYSNYLSENKDVQTVRVYFYL